MVPLTVDGLIYASSMVMLDSVRRKTPVPRAGAAASRPGRRWRRSRLTGDTTWDTGLLARLWHAWASGRGWPVSYELFTMIIRSAQLPANSACMIGLLAISPDPMETLCCASFC